MVLLVVPVDNLWSDGKNLPGMSTRTRRSTCSWPGNCLTASMLIAVCLCSGRAGASAARRHHTAVGRRSHPSIVPRAPDEVYLDSRYSGISATGGTHLATSVYLRCPVQEGIETSPVLKVKVWGILVYQPISIRCSNTCTVCVLPGRELTHSSAPALRLGAPFCTRN